MPIPAVIKKEGKNMSAYKLRPVKNFKELVLSDLSDRVTYNILHIDESTIRLFSYDQFDRYYDLSPVDVVNYGKHIWLTFADQYDKPCCPTCGKRLLGPTGTFEFDVPLPHEGNGTCSYCGLVRFKYYHFLGKCHNPITVFEITGLVLDGFMVIQKESSKSDN